MARTYSEFFLGKRVTRTVPITDYIGRGQSWLQKHINKLIPDHTGEFYAGERAGTMRNLTPGIANFKIHQLVLLAQQAKASGHTHIGFN